MKRLLLSLLALLNLACGPRSYVVNRAKASIVRISTDGGFCTGFVITNNPITTVLTANHCAGSEMTFDGEKGTQVDHDDYFDLALYSVPTLHKPSLPFRTSPVQEDEWLIGVGYGYGWTKPMATDLRVMIPNGPSFIHIESKHPTGIITQENHTGGQSGGPLLDRSGRVVGLITQDSEYLNSYSVNVTDIRAFLLNNDIEVR